MAYIRGSRALKVIDDIASNIDICYTWVLNIQSKLGEISIIRVERKSRISYIGVNR